MQNLQSLIGNLNTTCKRCLEESAQLCLANTNATVDIEHLLFKILEKPATDLSVIIKYYEIDDKKAKQQLQNAINEFKRGNNKTPSMSQQLIKLLERSWVITSLNLKQTQIRSAALLMAILKTEELLGVLVNSCQELLKIPRNKLEEDVLELIKSSPEDVSGGNLNSSTGGAKTDSGGQSSTQALDKFTIDLTRQAKEGKIDPIEGRDTEIRQMLDILGRRRQNNPILTGEAGVGKTAVVEGLALKIAAGDVPDSLKKVSIRTLDLGLLEAGAGMKGEFENRLKSVIQEVQSSLNPVILFIDEAHTLIGAQQNAQNDAANLLKPALARGELRTIAATTWDEYKRFFEKDAALTRRFQVIKVEEPSEDVAVKMLRCLTEKLEQHHKVLILDLAIKDAVRLSNRYIGGRKLPDKAVSVLDTACARVNLAQNSTPEAVETLTRDLELLGIEKGRLQKEELSGHTHQDRLAQIAVDVQSKQSELNTVKKAWEEELNLVKEINIVQGKILEINEQNGPDHPDMKDLKTQISKLKKDLEDTQGGKGLVPACVDGSVVAQVIAGWTGIPLGKMLRDEINTVLSLKEIMANRLIGQAQAVDTIAKHIVTYRANLDEPGKPVGVFLLAGPSGVGKTETALALADTLYGGERNLVTINMSEYQESHTVSSLKGSPPGYVGYGEGGVLTEAIRRNPYSVVLLDEIEKAHPDVLELFYQVFDKGILEDAEGIEIDFKNTVILMTTNLASETIMKECKNPKKLPEVKKMADIIRPELSAHFKPALLGRMTVVPYYSLNKDEITEIVHLKLDRIKKRFDLNHGADFSYDKDVIKFIADRCDDPDSGARNIDYIINQNLLPLLSADVLKHIADETPFGSIKVSIKRGEFTCDFETSKIANKA